MITLEDIDRARERIASISTATPLRRAHDLSRQNGAGVWLKLETAQDTGAFKLRGAANKILSLCESQSPPGLVTVSSGNHGRAVAFVARSLGLRAVVCITSLVPKNKIDGLRMFGAEVVIHGEDQNEAEIRARRLSAEEGLIFVPPFDDADIIAGQGVVGLELLEQRPDLERVLVPLSGGGLISGVALASKAVKPSIEIVGVSTEIGAAMIESLKAGRIVPVEERPSIADALPGPIPDDNVYTFRMCQELVDETVQVSEVEIETAMDYLFRYERLIVEGGAAVGVAALLSGRIPWSGKPTGIVITGDNIAPQKMLDVLARRHAQD